MTVTEASSSPDLLPRPLRLIAPYWALIMLVFAVYGNVFENAFLFDDDLLITLNSNLRGWSHIGDIFTGSTTSGAFIAGGFYRPLQMLLYLFAFQLGNGSTIGFHLINLSLHAANACLMFRLGRKLDFNPWGTFLVSAIWALHPLHTEAVTYMSATADPLFAFFCLAATVRLVPTITQKQIYQILPLFLLGLLSKETTVMLPLLVMACLYYTQKDRLNWRIYLRTWPLWIITIVYVIWREQAKQFDGPQTYARLYLLHSFATLKMYADHPLYRIYTFLATLGAYAKLMIWPTGLHMERAFSIYTIAFCVPVMVGLTMMVAALGQIGWSAKHPKTALPLAWGLLWFGAAHSPDSGILIPMNSLFLEHWMYLPSIGLLLGASETCTRLLARIPQGFGIFTSIVAAGFACIMGSLTYAQNEVWHDPASFYNNIFAYGEQSARAHNNLALYYSDRGDLDNAVVQFKQAIAISDSYAETRHNLALTLLRMPDQRGHIPEALENLHRAIDLDPNFYRSYSTMGDIYGATGEPDKAKLFHDKANEIIEQRR